MIFEYEYKPVIEDFSNDGHLSVNAILKIFENAGNAHSDYAGDSIFKTAGITKTWVLTEWFIQIDEYPFYSDSVKAETWSEGANSPLFANRNFILYKNGKACAKGTSVWVLVDFATQRLCKIEKNVLEKYLPEDKRLFEEKIAKIEKIEDFQSEEEIAVRRTDFDFNSHVHNLVYVDYAMQVLPDEAYKTQNFKNVRISYKSAVKEGRKVLCRYAKKDEKHNVFIFNEENQLCTMIQLS